LVFHERNPVRAPLSGSLARSHLKSEAILRAIHPSKYLHINNLPGDKRLTSELPSMNCGTSSVTAIL
jgi:hypothetical protein